MASVGETVSTNNSKGAGQQELQEEASKSKKMKYSSSTGKLGRKIILSYVEAIKGMNTLTDCNSCKIAISVARGGKNDIMKHVTSKNHKKSIAAEKKNQRITSFIAKGPEESDKLSCVETKFAMLVMKNNLRLAFVMNFRKSSATSFQTASWHKNMELKRQKLYNFKR